MTGRQRWAARVALAMLPIGAIMALMSVFAAVVVALLVIDTMVHRPAATGWLLAWCLGAVIVAARNTVKSIETMSSMEWRPMAQVALLSGLIVIAYPEWWIHA